MKRTQLNNIGQAKRWRQLVPATLLTLSAGVLACGPDFPMQLTDDRAESFYQLPEPAFMTQLKALAEPLPAFPLSSQIFSDQYDYQQDRFLSATEQAEQKLLTASDATLVAQMRQQQSVAAALALGAPLTAELRLYTAGAVAFALKQHASAETLFRQVLALPVAEQTQRRSWALYSLSRLLLSKNEPTATTEALALLQQLRSEVAAGLADPLQLAAASLGETARLVKLQNDWQQAIGLYATQAAYSESGRASLLQLSRELLALSDETLQPLLLQQPKVAQLLSGYLLSQYSGLVYADPEQISRLLQLISADPSLKLSNAMALAAVYYQQGDFSLTKTLLQQAADSPQRWWLSAKLAVRDNDLVAAAAFYAKAAQAFPTAPELPSTISAGANNTTEAITPNVQELQQQQFATQCRIQAEAGVLQLQRGDYLAAMRLLYQSGAEYWQDTAYIAERVLTSDELKQFVDQDVAPGLPKPASEWSYFGDTEPNTLLRQLLARKLLREQRFKEAPSYFVEPELKTLAAKYIQARQQSQSHWLSKLGQTFGVNFGHLQQAEATFEAAMLTREHGLELLGFEMAPDYQVFYGQFEFWQPEQPPVRQLPVPEAEQQRVQQSSALPDKRFHYRYLAAELASQSADLLPANSQAFAATLCHATTWLIHRDPELAQGYYQRYLQQGPYVSWGADFGSSCPAPDFVSAADRLHSNTKQQLRIQLRQLKPWWPVLLLLPMLWWWRRTRR
ncbi:MAG: hypothetical protein KKA56_12550 [Gammaproteobacteria bacterium]|nr:hypothetical protein [Gammaproteobacteria bacterium]